MGPAGADWSTGVDTDGDGIFDGVEIDKGTSPTLKDSDNDGVDDNWEIGIPVNQSLDQWRGRWATVVNYWNPDDPQIFPSATDHLGTFHLEPRAAEENTDSFYDYQDALLPMNPDSDGDGLSDGLELALKIGSGYPMDVSGNHYGDWLILDPTRSDSDHDGLPDPLEYVLGLTGFDHTVSGRHKDFDGDGLSDFDELYLHQTDLFALDSDNDGLSDSQEIFSSPPLDPTNPDTDGDGLKDGLEGSGRENDRLEFDIDGTRVVYWHDPLKDFRADSDGDGLSDQEEMAGLGDPQKADTDADGLSDLEEKALGTSPFLRSTDADGLTDKAELAYGTDPLKSDTDGDGLKDGDEVFYGTDPLRPDTDGDSLTDAEEVRSFQHYLDPLKADTDGDRLADADEVALGTDPNDPDTDGDGLNDGREAALGTDPKKRDPDNDDLEDLQEIQYGTDPFQADQDQDDFKDKDEILYGTDPRVADQDNDGWGDARERNSFTNPFVADTDGDGVIDSQDANPIYNEADQEQVIYPWNSSQKGYLQIAGDTTIRADGQTGGDYTVTLYGNDKAGQAVRVTVDEPGTIVPDGGFTDDGGRFDFRYTPQRRDGGSIFALMSVTAGSHSLQGEVYLRAPGIDIDTLTSLPYLAVGYAGKFKFKATMDTGDPVANPIVEFECLNGTVEHWALSATEFEATWAPQVRGRFPLTIVVSSSDRQVNARTTISAVAGKSRLQAKVDRITALFPRLQPYHPGGVALLEQALTTLNDAYYGADTDDQRIDIENQAEALFQISRTQVGIAAELRRVADSASALLLPAFSLDFALDYLYGKVENLPGIARVVGSAKSMSDSVFAALYAKLGASNQLGSALSLVRDKMTAAVSDGIQGAGAGKLKADIEVAVNQNMQQQVAVAVVQGVLGSATAGFDADVGAILADPGLDPGIWQADAVDRLATVRQLALQNTRAAGAMATLAATSGAVGNAADLIATGLTLTGVGAAPAALIQVVTAATNTLGFLTKAVSGLNYGVTLSQMATQGLTGVSGGRRALAHGVILLPARLVPPHALGGLPGARRALADGVILLPAGLIPADTAEAALLELEALGQTVRDGSLAQYVANTEGYAQTLATSAVQICLGIDHIQNRSLAGSYAPGQRTALIDTYLDLALAQLQNANGVWAALAQWDDPVTRENILVQAQVAAAAIERSQNTLAQVSSSPDPPVSFLPVITAAAGAPSTPSAPEAPYDIRVSVENQGTLAGNATLVLRTYGVDSAQFDHAIRALQTITMQGPGPTAPQTDQDDDGTIDLADAIISLHRSSTISGLERTLDFNLEGGEQKNLTLGPFETRTQRRAFLLEVAGPGPGQVLSMPGYADDAPPVLVSRSPAAGQILPAAPTEVSVWINDGSGSGRLQGGTVYLDAANIGEIASAGISSFDIDALNIASGTHTLTVEMTTAAAGSPLAASWTFSILGN